MAGPDTADLLDSPRILQEVQAARSAELRLESLNKLGKELLADLPGYDDISLRVTTALRDVERKRQSFVDTWVIVLFQGLILSYSLPIKHNSLVRLKKLKKLSPERN